MAKKPVSRFTLFVLLMWMISLVLFGALVLNTTRNMEYAGVGGKMAFLAANFPNLVAHAYKEIFYNPFVFREDYYPDVHGFKKLDQDFEDDGYLLESYFSEAHGQGVVDLVRLKDFSLVHRWVPDFEDVTANIELSARHKAARPWVKSLFVMTHPFLMKDGSMVFQRHSPLIAVDPCGKFLWSRNEHYHHAIEPGSNNTIWAVSRLMQSTLPEKFFPRFYDDGISHIGPTGKLLSEKSVAQILIENGYRGLLHGTSRYEIDVMHINDVQPALKDGPGWKKGDLLVSSRHKSTVFMYRPSTGKIIWLKTGPWLHQHDPDYMDDGRISILGNDVISFPGGGYEYRPFKEHLIDGHNEIYFYDPRTGEIETPFTDILEAYKVKTPTNGLLRILPNGDAFIVESDWGRVLRLGQDKARWVYVRRHESGKINRVIWPRYLTAREATPIIEALHQRECKI